MKAKPSKCKSLAQKKFDNRYPNEVYAVAQATTYSAYDSLLKISGKRSDLSATIISNIWDALYKPIVKSPR